jgi:putative effector of murein hydrolase
VAELWIAVTLAAFGGGLALQRRLRTPAVQPPLVAIVALVVVLLVTGVPYDDYASSTHLLSALLGPGVVALAVPLPRERQTLLRHGRPLLLAAACGTASAVAVGWGAGSLLHLSPPWELAVTSRSATSPISIALADQLHGAPALSAVISILAGLVGAVAGPAWLDLIRVRAPVARGLAQGIASHGLGTARILQEGHRTGAAAAVGMGVGGLIVAVVLPLVWR